MSRKFGVKEVVGIAVSVMLGLGLFAVGAFWLQDKLEEKISGLIPDIGSEQVSDSSVGEDPSGSESEVPGDSSEVEDPSGSESETPGDSSEVEDPSGSESEIPGDSSVVEDPSGSDSESPGDSSDAEHTAHDWVELRNQAATCDAEGMIFYECSCGALMAKTVPVAEHVEVILEYTAPTCETEGSKTYKCANCDLSVTEAIPAMGHAYEYGVCANVDCYTPDAEWLDDSENYYLEMSVEGELMYGNWYRVYRNNFLEFTSNSQEFKLSFDAFYYSEYDAISSYDDNNWRFRKTDEYIDVYISNVSFTSSVSGEEVTYKVDETATVTSLRTVSDGEVKVYRLSPVDRGEVTVGDTIVGNTYRLYKNGGSVLAGENEDNTSYWSFSAGGIQQVGDLTAMAQLGVITIEYETDDYVDVTINGGDMIATAPDENGEPYTYTITIGENDVVAMRYNVVQIMKVGE